jgi:hypothetical protein
VVRKGFKRRQHHDRATSAVAVLLGGRRQAKSVSYPRKESPAQETCQRGGIVCSSNKECSCGAAVCRIDTSSSPRRTCSYRRPSAEVARYTGSDGLLLRWRRNGAI